MPSPAPRMAFRLFQFHGITVYMHFTWFLVAVYEVQAGKARYSSIAWNVAEVISLFAIVLLHEFGHALACRSVGGTADTIMLWPLGGVAYVSPPQRPGATLWSITAGPLVNVALLPITYALLYVPATGDLGVFLHMIFEINLILLIFNILPIYPLDGGQILRSLLWFVMGRAKSLMAATVIGLLGAVGFGAFALYTGDWWLGLIALFAASQAWRGFQFARQLQARDNAPRRPDYVCPSCGMHPLIGPLWICSACKNRFDIFETNTICPKCGRINSQATCPECRKAAPLTAWRMPAIAVIPGPPVDAAINPNPPMQNPNQI
ncbi:MAG: site-2 protease family protein [Tepidisphaeraceae bacterium]